MKKVKTMILMAALLVVFAACGQSGAKLEKVTYEVNQAGINSQMTFEYDKDKNIQTAETKTVINYKEAGQTKESLEETYKLTSAMYKDMAGVTQKLDFGDKEANELLTMNIKEISEEDLSALFLTAVDDKGNVSLEDYTDKLKQAGYKEKE